MPEVEGLIIESPCNELRYSKKLKTCSSTNANIEASKAIDDIVKSVKDISSDLVDTDVLARQKDPLPIHTTSVAPLDTSLDNLMRECGFDLDPELVYLLNSLSDTVPATPLVQNTTALSFDDIESLLSDNLPPAPQARSTSPTSPEVHTPADNVNLNWMENLDILLDTNTTDFKFDPLQSSNELDSFLGL